MDEQTQTLLDVKDRIIEQQQEKMTQLEDLAEARRLNLMYQTKELAEHRDLREHIRQGPWRLFWWLLLENVWPFSVWYHRFDGGVR